MSSSVPQRFAMRSAELKRSYRVPPASKSEAARNQAGKRVSVTRWSDIIEVELRDDGIYYGADSREEFLEAYEGLRRMEGRGEFTIEERLRLPKVSSDHVRRAEWRERSRSLDWLKRYLSSDTGKQIYLDAGAGNCWLSWNLAKMGCSVCAVDLSLDRGDGLVAGDVYAERLSDNLARLRASFDSLPIVGSTIDIVIFNGSLHYSPRLLDTLTEATRVLRRGGKIIVMDSPIYRSKWSGEKMIRERGGPTGARYLVKSALIESALKLNHKLEFFPRDQGVKHLLRRARQYLRLGREPASMPWIVIEKK